MVSFLFAGMCSILLPQRLSICKFLCCILNSFWLEAERALGLRGLELTQIVFERLCQKLSEMSTSCAFQAVLLSLCSTSVDAHGMLIIPRSRNSVDMDLPDFKDGKNPATMMGGCNCADPMGSCPAALGPRADGNGQPCFWFQQGCTIGCPECNLTKGHWNTSACSKPTVSATVNDPKWRTMNLDAKAGSAEDVAESGRRPSAAAS